MRRGLFLFVLGIAFNVLVWLPEDTFNWDVLTLIGSALLLLAFARHLPGPALVVACVLVVILSPPLRAALDYADYWKDHTYEYDFNLRDVGVGFVVAGYFPLLPWLVFPLAGYLVTGRLYPEKPGPFPWSLFALGVVLFLAGVIAFVLGFYLSGTLAKHYLTGLAMFPASTAYVLATLGLSIVALIVLHRWLDQNPSVTGNGWTLAFLRRYSAYSLTVYFLHHAVHLWPLWIYGALYHGDPHYSWRQAMTTTWALALALAFVVVCTPLLVWLERGRRASLETLFRWVCE